MKQHPLIVGIGELLWDKLPSGKQIGGAPANAVYHASCLGAESYAVSAVGKDKLGDELLEAISKTNMHTAIERVDYPTGLVHVTLNNGMPEYNIVENAAWDYIPLTDNALTLVKKADAVCYGTLASRNDISHNTIMTLLKHTNPSSLRLFDINLRAAYYSKQLITELMTYADIFKMNSDEAIILKNILDINISDDDLCRMILEKYDLKYLIYTNGSLSSSIYTADRISTLKTPAVKVSDTIGAGDAFSGAFIYYILSGLSLEETHLMAVNTASFVCTQSGAWSKYPETMQKFV